MSKVSRRNFLTGTAQTAALAATGGLIWGYLLTAQQARAAPQALRPPGALPGDDFNAACIKCGQCVDACPFDTLALASAGEPAPIGTPYYYAREVPCYMCEDIPCMVACPTGALTEDLKDIKDSRMGLAVIDIENCLSWIGLRCEVCFRECPLHTKEGKPGAISVIVNPRKKSKHAMFVPIVHSDRCTGCGICEKACPTEKAAIRVVPPELVQGKIGEHYRLGWQNDAPITQEFKPQQRKDDDDESLDNALDVLNTNGL